MLKIVLIGFLSLVLLCMIPIMGGSQDHSGHLHHNDSASCATCMASVDVPFILVPLRFQGFALLAVPRLPKLVDPSSSFHPPRFRF